VKYRFVLIPKHGIRNYIDVFDSQTEMHNLELRVCIMEFPIMPHSVIVGA